MTNFENQFGSETSACVSGGLLRQSRQVYRNSGEHRQTKTPWHFSHKTISTKLSRDCSRRGCCYQLQLTPPRARDASTRGFNAIDTFKQRAFLVGKHQPFKCSDVLSESLAVFGIGNRSRGVIESQVRDFRNYISTRSNRVGDGFE